MSNISKTTVLGIGQMQLSTALDSENGEMVVKRVSIPVGLEEMMENLTKEVILKKPRDIYSFASDYFAELLTIRDKEKLAEQNQKNLMKSAEKEKLARKNDRNLYQSDELKVSKVKQLPRHVSMRTRIPSPNTLMEHNKREAFKKSLSVDSNNEKNISKKKTPDSRKNKRSVSTDADTTVKKQKEATNVVETTPQQRFKISRQMSTTTHQTSVRKPPLKRVNTLPSTLEAPTEANKDKRPPRAAKPRLKQRSASSVVSDSSESSSSNKGGSARSTRPTRGRLTRSTSLRDDIQNEIITAGSKLVSVQKGSTIEEKEEVSTSESQKIEAKDNEKAASLDIDDELKDDSNLSKVDGKPEEESKISVSEELKTTRDIEEPLLEKSDVQSDNKEDEKGTSDVLTEEEINNLNNACEIRDEDSILSTSEEKLVNSDIIHEEAEDPDAMKMQELAEFLESELECEEKNEENAQSDSESRHKRSLNDDTISLNEVGDKAEENVTVDNDDIKLNEENDNKPPENQEEQINETYIQKEETIDKTENGGTLEIPEVENMENEEARKNNDVNEEAEDNSNDNGANVEILDEIKDNKAQIVDEPSSLEEDENKLKTNAETNHKANEEELEILSHSQEADTKSLNDTYTADPGEKINETLNAKLDTIEIEQDGKEELEKENACLFEDVINVADIKAKKSAGDRTSEKILDDTKTEEENKENEQKDTVIEEEKDGSYEFINNHEIDTKANEQQDGYSVKENEGENVTTIEDTSPENEEVLEQLKEATSEENEHDIDRQTTVVEEDISTTNIPVLTNNDVQTLIDKNLDEIDSDTKSAINEISQMGEVVNGQQNEENELKSDLEHKYYGAENDDELIKEIKRDLSIDRDAFEDEENSDKNIKLETAAEVVEQPENIEENIDGDFNTKQTFESVHNSGKEIGAFTLAEKSADKEHQHNQISSVDVKEDSAKSLDNDTNDVEEAINKLDQSKIEVSEKKLSIDEVDQPELKPKSAESLRNGECKQEDNDDETSDTMKAVDSIASEEENSKVESIRDMVDEKMSDPPGVDEVDAEESKKNEEQPSFIDENDKKDIHIKENNSNQEVPTDIKDETIEENGRDHHSEEEQHPESLENRDSQVVKDELLHEENGGGKQAIVDQSSSILGEEIEEQHNKIEENCDLSQAPAENVVESVGEFDGTSIKDKAATKIQSFWKKVREFKKGQLLYPDQSYPPYRRSQEYRLTEKDLKNAAVIIQSLFRGYIIRKQFHNRHMRKYNSAKMEKMLPLVLEVSDEDEDKKDSGKSSTNKDYMELIEQIEAKEEEEINKIVEKLDNISWNESNYDDIRKEERSDSLDANGKHFINEEDVTKMISQLDSLVIPEDDPTISVRKDEIKYFPLNAVEAAVNIQKTYRGFKERKNFKEKFTLTSGSNKNDESFVQVNGKETEGNHFLDQNKEKVFTKIKAPDEESVGQEVFAKAEIVTTTDSDNILEPKQSTDNKEDLKKLNKEVIENEELKLKRDTQNLENVLKSNEDLTQESPGKESIECKTEEIKKEESVGNKIVNVEECSGTELDKEISKIYDESANNIDPNENEEKNNEIKDVSVQKMIQNEEHQIFASNDDENKQNLEKEPKTNENNVSDNRSEADISKPAALIQEYNDVTNMEETTKDNFHHILGNEESSESFRNKSNENNYIPISSSKGNEVASNDSFRNTEKINENNDEEKLEKEEIADNATHDAGKLFNQTEIAENYENTTLSHNDNKNIDEITTTNTQIDSVDGLDKLAISNNLTHIIEKSNNQKETNESFDYTPLSLEESKNVEKQNQTENVNTLNNEEKTKSKIAEDIIQINILDKDKMPKNPEVITQIVDNQDETNERSDYPKLSLDSSKTVEENLQIESIDTLDREDMIENIEKIITKELPLKADKKVEDIIQINTSHEGEIPKNFEKISKKGENKDEKIQSVDYTKPSLEETINVKENFEAENINILDKEQMPKNVENSVENGDNQNESYDYPKLSLETSKNVEEVIQIKSVISLDKDETSTNDKNITEKGDDRIEISKGDDNEQQNKENNDRINENILTLSNKEENIIKETLEDENIQMEIEHITKDNLETTEANDNVKSGYNDKYVNETIARRDVEGDMKEMFANKNEQQEITNEEDISSDNLKEESIKNFNNINSTTLESQALDNKDSMNPNKNAHEEIQIVETSNVKSVDSRDKLNIDTCEAIEKDNESQKIEINNIEEIVNVTNVKETEKSNTTEEILENLGSFKENTTMEKGTLDSNLRNQKEEEQLLRIGEINDSVKEEALKSDIINEENFNGGHNINKRETKKIQRQEEFSRGTSEGLGKEESSCNNDTIDKEKEQLYTENSISSTRSCDDIKEEVDTHDNKQNDSSLNQSSDHKSIENEKNKPNVSEETFTKEEDSTDITNNTENESLNYKNLSTNEGVARKLDEETPKTEENKTSDSTQQENNKEFIQNDVENVPKIHSETPIDEKPSKTFEDDIIISSQSDIYVANKQLSNEKHSFSDNENDLTDGNSSSLLHSSEYHDLIIEENPPKQKVRKEEEKSLEDLEASGEIGEGMLHSSEFHDSLLPIYTKMPEDEEMTNKEKEEEYLIHTSELHDSLLLPNIETLTNISEDQNTETHYNNIQNLQNLNVNSARKVSSTVLEESDDFLHLDASPQKEEHEDVAARKIQKFFRQNSSLSLTSVPANTSTGSSFDHTSNTEKTKSSPSSESTESYENAPTRPVTSNTSDSLIALNKSHSSLNDVSWNINENSSTLIDNKDKIVDKEVADIIAKFDPPEKHVDTSNLIENIADRDNILDNDLSRPMSIDSMTSNQSTETIIFVNSDAHTQEEETSFDNTLESDMDDTSKSYLDVIKFDLKPKSSVTISYDPAKLRRELEEVERMSLGLDVEETQLQNKVEENENELELNEKSMIEEGAENSQELPIKDVNIAQQDEEEMSSIQINETKDISECIQERNAENSTHDETGCNLEKIKASENSQVLEANIEEPVVEEKVIKQNEAATKIQKFYRQQSRLNLNAAETETPDTFIKEDTSKEQENELEEITNGQEHKEKFLEESRRVPLSETNLNNTNISGTVSATIDKNEEVLDEVTQKTVESSLDEHQAAKKIQKFYRQQSRSNINREENSVENLQKPLEENKEEKFKQEDNIRKVSIINEVDDITIENHESVQDDNSLSQHNVANPTVLQEDGIDLAINRKDSIVNDGQAQSYTSEIKEERNDMALSNSGGVQSVIVTDDYKVIGNCGHVIVDGSDILHSDLFKKQEDPSEEEIVLEKLLIQSIDGKKVDTSEVPDSVKEYLESLINPVPKSRTLAENKDSNNEENISTENKDNENNESNTERPSDSSKPEPTNTVIPSEDINSGAKEETKNGKADVGVSTDGGNVSWTHDSIGESETPIYISVATAQVTRSPLQANQDFSYVTTVQFPSSSQTSETLGHSGEFHDSIPVSVSGLTPAGDGSAGDGSGNVAQEQTAEGAVQSSDSQENVVPLAVQLNQAPAGDEKLTSPRPKTTTANVSDEKSSRAQTPRKDDSALRSKPDNSSAHRDQPTMESATDKRNNATMVPKNEEAEAATKIQASFRGYQVRKQMKIKNGGSEISNTRRSARRKSSSRIDGNKSAQKLCQPSDLEEKSATKIQAGIRGFLVRKRQKNTKKNMTPESS